MNSPILLTLSAPTKTSTVADDPSAKCSVTESSFSSILVVLVFQFTLILVASQALNRARFARMTLPSSPDCTKNFLPSLQKHQRCWQKGFRQDYIFNGTNNCFAVPAASGQIKSGDDEQDEKRTIAYADRSEYSRSPGAAAENGRCSAQICNSLI
jgi:hypothetical protein